MAYNNYQIAMGINVSYPCDFLIVILELSSPPLQQGLLNQGTEVWFTLLSVIQV